MSRDYHTKIKITKETKTVTTYVQQEENMCDAGVLKSHSSPDIMWSLVQIASALIFVLFFGNQKETSEPNKAGS